MEQLNFFGDQKIKKIKTADTWELFVDGAARSNPGPAGAGIYLRCNEKNAVKKGFALGSRTNNEAEYLAFLIGVIIAVDKMQDGDMLTINSDSELLVKQVKGIYKVKKAELQILFKVVMSYLGQLNYKIQHVMREKNSVADKLANQGVDRQTPVPAYIQKKLPL